jgi:transposase
MHEAAQNREAEKEALRALKRRISDAVYRQLVEDDQALRGRGGQARTTPKTSVTGSTPTPGSSVKPQPGPQPKATQHPAA